MTMCNDEGKILFSTMRSALQAVVEQFEKHGRSFEVYADGGHFHLTTTDTPLTGAVLARVKEAAR